MTVWVSKYALTLGVFQLEATVTAGRAVGRMDGRQFSLNPRDCHMTQDGALKRAELLRLRKLRILQKRQLALQALTFEPDQQQWRRGLRNSRAATRQKVA